MKISDEEHKKNLEKELKKLDLKKKIKEKRDTVWNMWIHCVKPGERRKVLGGKDTKHIEEKEEDKK